MMRITTGLLVAALLGAGGSLAMNPVYLSAAPRVSVTSTQQQSAYAYSPDYWNVKKAKGWTNRQVQRMATKRRNKARHKKATRG